MPHRKYNVSMSFGGKESTADEICRALSVTRSWLSFAAKNLDMKRSGQGKQQTFSRDDVEIFKMAKMLLRCDYTWNQIKAIQQEELEVKKKIEGPGVKAWGETFPLLLVSGVRLSDEEIARKDKRAAHIVEQSNLLKIRSEILKKIEGVIEEDTDFKSMNKNWFSEVKLLRK